MVETTQPVLSFELKHKSIMPLAAFTHALERMNARYGREVRERGKGDEPHLYIAEIRKGSIVVDLVQSAAEAAPAIIPALESANNLFDFGKKLGEVLNYFRGEGPKPENITTADCDDVRALMAPAIQVDGGGLVIRANSIEIGTIIHMTAPEARVADNRAAAERMSLSDESERIHREELFVWHQVRNTGAVTGDKKSSPDKGIVAAISKRALPVTFSDEETKIAMTHGDFNPFERSFVVDVKVLVGPNGASAYRIQKIHDTI